MNNKIFNQAIKYLAAKRYTVIELKKKLKKKFPELITSNEIQEVIETLIKIKYLNDEDYVRAYTDEIIRTKPMGAKLLKQKLIQKGIAPELLSKQLPEQQIDDEKLLKVLLKKKLKTLPSTLDEKHMNRLKRFLYSRGFSPQLIIKHTQPLQSQNSDVS